MKGEINRSRSVFNGMDKPQIIGFGLNGLIGSRVVELLGDKLDFVSLSLENGVDITKPETITQIKEYRDADYILHLAAITDVDVCEKEKDMGEKSNCWKVNVGGTKNIAEIALASGKKVIYISTDFVFDGEKEKGEFYSEKDLPNPINFYAKTKYAGEQEIEKSGCDYMIIRTAFPYRANFDNKKDFFRGIKERLKSGDRVSVVGDQYFCPTFVDDFSSALAKLIEIDAYGIYHVVGRETTSPYQAALNIAEIFNFDKILIEKTTREEFFKGKAKRPFNLGLKNDKIEKLGIQMKTFEKGLLEIKKQLEII